MNILSAENISLEKGEKKLFENLSFGIDSRSKIGLIGRNGSGKSSLLSVLAGTDEPGSGKISTKTGTRIHLAPQNPVFNPDHTVASHLLDKDHVLGSVLARYQEACRQMQESPGEAAHRELDAAMAEMHSKNGWKYEGELRAVLASLGIPDRFRKMGELSGGMAKKTTLAQAVLSMADLLMLDEPTNHLDGETIMWLEDHLSRRSGAMVLVTHDRYFLERVCDEIWELESGTIQTYPGHWSVYLEKKAEKLAAENKKADRVSKLLIKEREWMKRAPCARGTKPKARIERIREMERAEGMESRASAQMSLSGRRLGKKVIELHHVSKTQGDKLLFRDFSYSFKRGERIGLVGPNGSGKSSLIHILKGVLQPDSGRVETGETVAISIFDQHPPALDENKTVLQSLREKGEVFSLEKEDAIKAPELLERFLFQKHQHYQKVGRLSGGERRRLQLLKVLLENPNFLIFDEPTNDLDVDTLSALEETLQSFDGTLLIISHDRYFLDKTVDFLITLDGKGGVKGYPGLYSDYLLWQQTKKSQDREAEQKQKNSLKPQPDDKQKNQKRSYKEERELKQIWQQIDLLEQEKNQLEEFFASGGNPDSAEMEEKSRRHQQVEAELLQKMERWEELEGKG